MTRAETFAALARMTGQIEETKAKLVGMIAKERELYATLKLPYPEDTKRKPRKHLTKEAAIGIRLCIVKCMGELNRNGLTWLPMSLIVRRVNEEKPNAEDTDIEAQLRWLAKNPSSSIEHNGLRGNGSAYTNRDPEKTAPKPTDPMTQRVYTT